MITLHESNITSFPHDNGIGVLKDVIRAYAEEELNGLFEFYMEYDSEGHLVDELKEERIIKAKAQDKLGYQLFRIYSITKNHENDNLIVRAQHITYDLANNFVESLEARNLTKKQVMEKIGSSTAYLHPFNVTSSNTTTISSTSLYRTNPLQMIGGMEGSVLQIWGGQIERDNFNLILHDRRGSDDGVKVTYEKNITGLEATFDISGLVTRIFPFVYIEATDDEPARLITVNGKYIDSPYINDYEKIYIKPIDYSNDERIDTQDKTDDQIRQQLTNIASQYFNETGNDKIKVDMEVQFEHLWETEEYKDLAVLELVGMGDTVTIEHSRLKVNATAIVNYIRYDCIAEKNEEVRLGSVKARLTDNVNRVVDVAEKVEQAQQTANQAIRMANGKNVSYWGPDEPEGGIEGDLWFRVVDGEYTRTYRHDGIQWQLVLSVDVRDAIDEAQQAKDEAQQAVDRANQATQQATNAINQAQTAFDEAQQALSTANNALTQATSAFSLANDAFNEVESLSTIVDENTGEISTIKQSVIGLQTRVSDNEGNISNLTQIAQGLQTQVTDIEGNVSTLQQTSSSLAGRLTDAEGNITTLTATVSGLQTTVTNVQGDVSSVTQLANALQVRMTNAEGDISTLTQTASSLQSTVSSLRDVLGTWERIYRVNTENPENLTEIDGSPLSDLYTYKVTAKVVGTSTITTAVAIFKANNSGGNGGQGWTLEILYELGKGSNHPEFFLNNGVPAIRLYNHRQLYNVIVSHEKSAGSASDVTVIQSQITQLSDAINLRVMKGDVINQINISTESILIDGKRIHITGQTTIDNGVIKSAHIQSLDAGKITTGTLDAGKISVINLSANSIVGGVLQSQNGNTTFNLNTGELYIDSGSIHIDGGLTDAQIRSASKWNNQGTFIDDRGVYTGIISANQLVGGILESKNSNTRFNLNTGQLTMQNAEFVLDGGATIRFRAPSNNLTYSYGGRRAGIGFGNSVGGKAITFVGHTRASDPFTARDSSDFHGFVSNAAIGGDSPIPVNTVVGQYFRVRNNIGDIDNGFEFNVTSYAAILRPLDPNKICYLGVQSHPFTQVTANEFVGELRGLSSRELKKNIKPMSLEDSLQFIKNTEIVSFNWKKDKNPSKEDIKVGFILEDLDMKNEHFIKQEGGYKVNNVIFLQMHVVQNLLKRVEIIEKELFNHEIRN